MNCHISKEAENENLEFWGFIGVDESNLLHLKNRDVTSKIKKSLLAQKKWEA